MKKRRAGIEEQELSGVDQAAVAAAGSEASLQAAEAPPAKRTRAKKAAKAAPAEPEADSFAAKPAKKAIAKKTRATPRARQKALEEADPVAEAPLEPAIERVAAQPEQPAPRKKHKSAASGRDRVVDAPGAAKIAAVPSETASHSANQLEIAMPEPSRVNSAEPKLERLQKILARAGVSSRRKAEELISGGLVQINGKVVTELGVKADAERDHIRVDGKLLQGPERRRYFMLNKPKGYVTTVSDPENRPTVMHFFSSERERLYPVGRLDYLSEGLLLVTNDGELANKLTKAASGVEKTYLVKVAGQPRQEAIEALRTGVVIEKGRGIGSGRVRTAPAQIRQVRQGDNPWYEVIVIEGRNRELRKMFEEIGHHVEKIRRIGYGPLILDIEPGESRELEAEEVHSLRMTSEGKWKTRRRRGAAPAQLPTVAGKAVRFKPLDGRPELGRRENFLAKPHRDQPPVTEYVLPPRKLRTPELKGDEQPSKPRPDFNPGFKPGSRTGAKPPFRGERPSKPFRPAGKRTDFAPRHARPQENSEVDRRGQSPGKYPGKAPGIRIEPVTNREWPRQERPSQNRPQQDHAEARSFQSRPAPSERGFKRRDFKARPGDGAPPGKEGSRPFRPQENRPASALRPRGADGPAANRRLFRPGMDSSAATRQKPADRLREFPSGRVGAASQKSSNAKPAFGGKRRPGAETGDEPRKKERWRNSFTGKNKGRPKPKAKG